MSWIVPADSGYGHQKDPFRTVADGYVTGAGWNGAYGKRVEITDDNGVLTRYAHLSVVAVAIGQRVKCGAIFGRIGSTGRSAGPHLDYETWVNGQAVDPVRFWRTSDDLQALSTQ